MQDSHGTYREIKSSLGITSYSIHSIMHEYLAVKKISESLKKNVCVEWCKEMLENTMAVPQKTFIRSSQVTNHGPVRISPKQSKS